MRWTSGTMVACLALGGAVLAAPNPPRVNPRQVRPAMLAWRIGTTSPDGPSRMVETVTRGTFQGKPVWRVTHHADDPTTSRASEFDLYDVDPETLAPIRSVMRNPGFSLDLAFSPDHATYHRTSDKDTIDERIPLSGPVMPEGPGGTVFLASLPLVPGYTTTFLVVDRWGGKEAGRVKTMTLSVAGRSRIDTPMGPRDALEVHCAPADNSFRIVRHVRAAAPHYPFRVEYVRGKTRLVSDVTAMAIEDY